MKTLKDLKWVVSGWNDGEVLDAVKSEAIKDYKEIEKENRPVSNGRLLDYIKSKNNITEKDLFVKQDDGEKNGD